MDRFLPPMPIDEQRGELSREDVCAEEGCREFGGWERTYPDGLRVRLCTPHMRQFDIWARAWVELDYAAKVLGR